MEEEISRMKTFLKDFNNDQIQSPTSDEITYTRVGNYGLDPEDVTGQVIDWILNYLDNRKCPYSLALFIAKEAAQQVSASFSALPQSETDDVEKSCNSAAVYDEAMRKLPAICNSFLNQTNLEPSCSLKYTTSVFAIKNKRRKMEDRYVIHHDLNAVLDMKDVPHQSYYAVFDGHSGRDAASYASAQLHINIAKHPDFFTNTPKAIIEGYQITDLNFLNKCNKWSNIKSGCTVVSALIRENTVYLSWLGDSQAVLVKEGVPLTITNPHKPDREDEKMRIESLGGHVSHVGTWRVNGLLAVTRAIGDPDQKRFISSEPELSVLNLDGKEDFLILACDGLWDGMSPEDVTGALYRYLEDSSPDEPLDAVAAKLVHQSKLQGSEDNITAIVIFLRDIKTIKENSPKFMTSAYSVQDHDFISMNGGMKTLDLEHASDTPFSKPTVLELNAASSKKLKNAANVMSSAGFGSSSYSYQYGENTAEGAFQHLDSSVMDTAQSAFHCQSVTASCFAPEATALSELPTPPIDDMLASQQSENFYSTDLYKEFSNSMHSSQVVDVSSSVDSNTVANETFQSPILDSPSKPVTCMVADNSNMSLLNTESISSANPEAKISPDEAVGVASTVVSTAIETAVKCLSSSETVDSVPASSPKKLNPYAKPFIMKSYFNPVESESTTVASSEASDTSVTSGEQQGTELDNQFMTDTATDLLAESKTDQAILDKDEFKQFIGDEISQSIAGNTAEGFIPDQQVSHSVVDFVASEHSELEIKHTTEKYSYLATESNPPEQLINQTIGGNIEDLCKSELNSNDFPNEDLTSVIETDSVLNSDIAQKCSTYEGSDISVEENVIRIKHETEHEENKLSILDLPAGNTNLSVLGEDVTVDINDLPTSEVSKDANLSPVSSESSAACSKTPEQKLLVDVSEQLLSLDLPEHCQNFDSTDMSLGLTSENTSVVSENKSKHDTNEKCIADVTKDDPLESAHLLDNLKNELPSCVNTLSDLTPVEILAQSPTQEPQKEFNTPASLLQSCSPSDNQNSSSCLPSESTLSSNSEKESKCVDIEKHIVDTVEKNVIETSQLITSMPSEPISLMDIKTELIPAEAEVPSDPSVEDSHTETVAVDLKSLPVGIPEAEGVTEDIDSDSEKDGGWSYMKGNTVSGSKSKPLNKTSGTQKSNEAKSSVATKTRRDISKPNLDVKSKMKNVTIDKTKNTLADKMKNTTVDKPKTVVADKSKSTSTVDKTKTLASVDKAKNAVVEKKPDIKTKVVKSSTLSTATKVPSDKTSRVTGFSSIKKETTETTKTTSTAARSTRPTTLVRSSVPASKPGSASADRNVVASKVAAKPKMSSAITETRSAVKTTTSTLSKGQTISQTKSSTSSTRITQARPATTVPNKTSTIAKSTVQKSVASESKPKQPASTTASTLRKPLTNTVKKSEVKEVKDSVNKQIVAKKSTTASKIDSSSTLMSRRVTSASTKSTVSRVASSAAKSGASKKDVPKFPGLKSTPKNVGSKVSQDSSSKGKEKKAESARSKTEETKNTLNIESDQKNIAEIVQVAEEKFTLETSDKEMLVKEKCEVSSEEKNIAGSLTNPVTPAEDKTPNVECSPESL